MQKQISWYVFLYTETCSTSAKVNKSINYLKPYDLGSLALGHSGTLTKEALYLADYTWGFWNST